MPLRKGYSWKKKRLRFHQDRLTYDRTHAFLADTELTFVQKAFRLMLKGGWIPQDKVGRLLDSTGTDAGAWIRDSRKPENGAYVIEYQKIEGRQHYRLHLFPSGRAKYDSTKRRLFHLPNAPENFSKATLVKLVRRMRKTCTCGACKVNQEG